MITNQSSIFYTLFLKYKKKSLIIKELDNLEIIVGQNGDIFTTTKNNIRSNGRKDNRKGKKLKPSIDKKGYLKIVLSNNCKKKTYLVHRLVARTYLKDYDETLQVNHINGIKSDNSVENLEMCTPKENVKHSIEMGLKPELKRNELGQFCGKEVM